MLHFPSPDIGVFGRRQRHARGHRIPVSIVAHASAARDRNTAVVVDDFGADEALLPEIGCRCCTVRMKLQGTLRRLLAERGERPFDRVAVETAQDLAPILRTFATERALGAEFYVEQGPIPPVSAGIHNFVLTEDAPLSWDRFSRFISTLVMLRGPDLLHVRGLLNVTGCRGPVVVQFLQHLAHRPLELQAWPDGDPRSRIEFVTRNIEEKTVRALFAAMGALA